MSHRRITRRCRPERVWRFGPDHPITKRTKLMMRDLGAEFREKFGRDPRPEDDPVFWDPDSDSDVPMPLPQAHFLGLVRRFAAVGMTAAGVDPEAIFATFLSGIMATRANWRRLDAEDRRAYLDALELYRSAPADVKKVWETDLKDFGERESYLQTFNDPDFAEIYRGAIGGPITPPDGQVDGPVQ